MVPLAPLAPILTQALFLFYFLPNQNNMANHPSQYSNSIATRPLECFDKDISLLQLYKQDFVNLDFPIFIGFTCMGKSRGLSSFPSLTKSSRELVSIFVFFYPINITLSLSLHNLLILKVSNT